MTLLGRMRLNKIHVITFSLSFREDYPVLNVQEPIVDVK